MYIVLYMQIYMYMYMFDHRLTVIISTGACIIYADIHVHVWSHLRVIISTGACIIHAGIHVHVWSSLNSYHKHWWYMQIYMYMYRVFIHVWSSLNSYHKYWCMYYTCRYTCTCTLPTNEPAVSEKWYCSLVQ